MRRMTDLQICHDSPLNVLLAYCIGYGSYFWNYGLND